MSKRQLLIIVLLILSMRSFAQEVHMKNLSGREKRWAIFHPIAAKKAKKIVPFVREEVRIKIAEGKIDSLIHGGQADAFRHALWMALMAKHIGNKKAVHVGKLHEMKNKDDFFKNEKEDNSLQDSVSCQMDLLNNELGAAYGGGYKKSSDKEIEDLILTGISNGEFFMLFRNKKNQFLSCDGNVVETKDRVKNKQWYLPYCLVPSNNTAEIPTR